MRLYIPALLGLGLTAVTAQNQVPYVELFSILSQ
jgi:hypothetical protein